MSHTRNGIDGCSGDGDGDGDRQRKYSLIRNRPMTPSVAMQVATATKTNVGESSTDESEDVSPTTGSRRLYQQGQLSLASKPAASSARKSSLHHHRIPEESSQGDCLESQLDDPNHGSIKIHSLSTNASVLVPITHCNNIPSAKSNSKIHLLENNYTRPRTALKNLPTPRSRIPTGNGDGSRPSTRGGDNSASASARSSIIGSRHACVRPGNSGYSNYSLMHPSSARPYTATKELLHRSLCKKDHQTVRLLRKIFHRSFNREDEYNEWRDGMDDPTDTSRALRELSEELYYREDLIHENNAIYGYSLYLGRIVELLDDFALLPVPPGFIVKCKITRSRKGIDGRLFPQYFLHLQRAEGPDVLLLSARKNKKLSTSYVISTDPADLSTKSPSCLGRVDANLRGSEFTLYTPSKTDPNEVDATNAKRDWESLLSVEYESNTLGYKGPRKMAIKIPLMKSDYERENPGNFKDEKPNDLIIKLKNRDPYWSSETNSFILNFHGRVDVASVKNFQIHHPDLSNCYLLQFGRMFKDDSFILDFTYPFCPLQAFAIALSSFDVKWGLE